MRPNRTLGNELYLYLTGFASGATRAATCA